MAIQRRPGTEQITPIPTVIADDHRVVRSGLRALIEDDAKMCEPGAARGRPFRVIAEAENGIAAIAAVKQHQPELLMLDVSMPLAGGAEVINEIKRWSPATCIAVFTGITAGGTLAQLIAAGIDGLFSKAAADSELVNHLPRLLAGGQFVSPRVLQILESGSPGQKLTARERQILHMVIIGKGNLEIAQTLHLTEKTVSNHRTRLMAKLDVHSLSELIAYAHAVGLLSAGESN